jgi:hypothetical protein
VLCSSAPALPFSLPLLLSDGHKSPRRFAQLAHRELTLPGQSTTTAALACHSRSHPRLALLCALPPSGPPQSNSSLPRRVNAAKTMNDEDISSSDLIVLNPSKLKVV